MCRSIKAKTYAMHCSAHTKRVMCRSHVSMQTLIVCADKLALHKRISEMATTTTTNGLRGWGGGGVERTDRRELILHGNSDDRKAFLIVPDISSKSYWTKQSPLQASS